MVIKNYRIRPAFLIPCLCLLVLIVIAFNFTGKFMQLKVENTLAASQVENSDVNRTLLEAYETTRIVVKVVYWMLILLWFYATFKLSFKKVVKYYDFTGEEVKNE